MKKNIAEATIEEEEMEEIEEEDPFSRLPNEIMVLIFSKIAEAKFLCWVSLVSTRFASLILQTKVVTMKIPTSISPNNQSLPQRFFNFLTNPLHRFFLNPQSPSLSTPAHPIFTPFYLHSLANFLSKFSSLEILIVIAPCTNNDSSSIHKWIAHFKPSEITRFVVLFAKEETTVAGNQDQEYMQSAYRQLMDILMGYQCVWSIVANSPNIKLQWVVITDPQNKWRIYLDQTQIVEMKNTHPELVGLPSLPKKSSSMEFNLWPLPLGALPDGADPLPDGADFKEVKIASFITPRNSEETDPFEADKRKYLEALEDVTRKDPVLNSSN